MGSGRTGAARSATSASVAAMAFVTGTKMCVLILLRVFAWVIFAERIYIPISKNIVYHI